MTKHWYCFCALFDLGLVIENENDEPRCHRCNAQRSRRTTEASAHKTATKMLWTELQETRKALNLSDRQNDNLRSDLLDRYNEKRGRK